MLYNSAYKSEITTSRQGRKGIDFTMSWLKNVGNFLEKLDEGAEKVAEDRVASSQHGMDYVPEDVQLQSILTARGLQPNDMNEADAEEDVNTSAFSEDEDALDGLENSIGENREALAQETATKEIQNNAVDYEEANSGQPALPPTNEVKDSTKSEVDNAINSDQGMVETAGDAREASLTNGKNSDREHDQIKEPSNIAAIPQTPQRKNPPTSSTHSNINTPTAVSRTSSNDVTLTPTSHSMVRESQKEARTLRRHVVALNKQLEHAETELEAQRIELERAAERMEKDRARFKEDREKEKARHAEEMKAIKAQNEKTLKELKQRSDKQIEDVRKHLRDVEDRRMQEGGDWNKELVEAVQREQEMAQKLAMIEDEKSTLLSQISILQDQQLALGNRIESLTQTSDNAMERERESDARLDEALNLHARQIAQRQARESELERTVAELGAALVAERSKRPSSINGTKSLSSNDNQNSAIMSNARLESMQQDLESLTSQLNFEKERNEALQNELRDVSNERTDEATTNHSRQIKYDRHVAELTNKIARLESDLRVARAVGQNSQSSQSDYDAKHLRELSEEVLIQREKLANCTSGISTLKSRLKVANERVRNAEAALENAESRSTDSDFRDIEKAPFSGSDGMRRRGGNGHKRSSRANEGQSIRAALHLDAVRSNHTEQIGKALDNVDSFLTSSGKFLRYNALARLIFIAYLLTLHIWTFILVRLCLVRQW